MQRVYQSLKFQPLIYTVFLLNNYVQWKAVASTILTKLEKNYLVYFVYKSLKCVLLAALYRYMPRKIYVCQCGKSYKNQPSLSRHFHHECGKEPQLTCSACPRKFKRRDHLQRHFKDRHLGHEVYSDYSTEVHYEGS